MSNTFAFPMLYRVNADVRNTYDTTALINGEVNIPNSFIVTSFDTVMVSRQTISGIPGFIRANIGAPNTIDIRSEILGRLQNENSLISWIFLYDSAHTINNINMSLLWGRYGTNLSIARSYGKSTLINGVVTITNNYENAESEVFVSVDAPVNSGFLTIQHLPDGSFDIRSTNSNDNSIVNWMQIFRTDTSAGPFQEGGLFCLDRTIGNASYGTATLSGGTVTVNTTLVLINDIIIVSYKSLANNQEQGFLSVPNASIVPGVSFVINSDNNNDSSTVNWWILKTFEDF